MKDIPFFPIQENLYFIGIHKLIVKVKGDFLVVELGKGKYERLANYLKMNKQVFKDKLTVLSLKNERSPIGDIVNNLV